MPDANLTFDDPEQPGWYVIEYCWSVREGVFRGVAYWDEEWQSNLPIGRSAGPFDTEENAEKAAKAFRKML